MKKFKNLVVVSVTIGLIVSGCSGGGGGTTTTVGNWVARSGFDGNGRSGAVSFVIGDTAYVATGYDGTVRYSDMYAYDAGADQWIQRASMPAAAGTRNAATAFAVGNRGYIVGGYDGVNKLQDVWEYNQSTGQWTQKTNLPDPPSSNLGSGARYGAVGFGIGNYGYICSGYTGSHTKDLWRFNPSNNSWTQMKSMNTPNKRTGAVALVYNDTAYIVSGSNNGVMNSEVARYNPSTDTWTRLRDIANVSSDSYDDTYTSIVRTNAVGFVIGTKGYLATGQNGSNVATVWEYDFTNDTWSAKTNFERSARNAAVGFSVKGRGYVGLGTNSTYYYDNLDEFKPNDTYNAND